MDLPFHELITELWDYAQKERIGQATTKQTAAATFLTFVPHPSRDSRPREKSGKGGKGGRGGKGGKGDRGPKERDFCNNFATYGFCPYKDGFCKYIHKEMPRGICYFWQGRSL